MPDTNDLSTWFYASGQSQLGPVSIDELRAMLAAGELPWSTLVWTSGMVDWLPAESVAIVSGERFVNRPPLPMSARPVGEMTYYGTANAPLPQTMAMTSLILGASSFAGSCIPYLQVLTLPSAIGAIITGVIARRQIKRGEAGGAGMALAGIILGIVYLILLVALIAVFIGLFYFMANSMGTPNSTWTLPGAPPPTSVPTTVPVER